MRPHCSSGIKGDGSEEDVSVEVELLPVESVPPVADPGIAIFEKFILLRMLLLLLLLHIYRSDARIG